MKNEDKEAFEKWWQQLYDNHVEFRDWQGCDLATDGKEDMRYGWQAACEYKQKEIYDLNQSLETSVYHDKKQLKIIQKLQAENEKLKNSLNFTLKAAEYLFKPDEKLADGLFPTSYFTLSYEGDLELIEKTKLARQVLKELEDK